MNNFIKVLLCVSVLTACGGSGSNSSGPDVIDGGECSVTNQNQALLDYLREDYYWYEQIPQTLNAASFDSPSDLLDAVRVPQDLYSFIITEEQYQASYVDANSVAYGFSYRFAGNGQALEVRFVYDNGSAHDAGLARGDRITAIDGVAIGTLVAQVNAGTNSWANIFGPSTEGYTGQYSWTKPNGQQVVADLVKTVVDTNTVLHHEVVNAFEQKVGYMVFNRFIDRSKEDLNVAFNDFAAQHVESLIVDLRYNGGGLVSVANQLSTQIAGEHVAGETFVNLVYNDKNSAKNTSSLFDLGVGVEQLNLDKVVVLTSAATCSASELVINALSPFVDVVTVGNATCGKPIGMNPVQICDKVIFAINFETTNGVGEGGYFDGLPATCFAQDQIVGDWGDLQDPLLQEGLYYTNNQQCFSRRSPLGEQKPSLDQVDWRLSPLQRLNVI